MQQLSLLKSTRRWGTVGELWNPSPGHIISGYVRNVIFILLLPYPEGLHFGVSFWVGFLFTQPGQTCAVNFEFWTARLGHRVFSKMDWYFHLGLFSCKNGDPKESFAFGFMDLSLMVCLWQKFEIENGQKSQFWHLQFSWILGFCQKHPIFKMSQFLIYPTNFQI